QHRPNPAGDGRAAAQPPATCRRSRGQHYARRTVRDGRNGRPLSRAVALPRGSCVLPCGSRCSRVSAKVSGTGAPVVPGRPPCASRAGKTMTTPMPPAPGYDGPDAVPLAAPRAKIRPGRTWYLLPLAALLGGVAWIVFGLTSIGSEINSFARAPLPAGGGISLNPSGGDAGY